MRALGLIDPARTNLIVAPLLLLGLAFGIPAHAQDCAPAQSPTFTVQFPKLGSPPDEEGQGWNLPAVWAGHPAATADSIEVPNGRPIYALIVSGYRSNAYLDELLVYDFARHLMAQGAYVHYAWWNNLLAPYMERPLHYSQSHPGSVSDLTNFTTPAAAADKAVPGEDYQFVADAKLFLSAIRQNNPSAIIIVVGHSMGGGAVVHLGAQADVLIDILAPIDPVGNRNYPWAGPVLYQNTSHFNWTRWRATRNKFLGYKSVAFEFPDGCEPYGPWLKSISEAEVGPACVLVGAHVHAASALTFGSHIANLHHRWQNENLFPFDYQDNYLFGHAKPPGGTTSQVAVATDAFGSDPGGWPTTLQGGGDCCPIGPGVSWPGDGHGEIVGYRGPAAATRALGVKVRTSPQCTGCSGTNWPARTFSGGTWGNGNSGSRVSLLKSLETLPLNQSWAHQPYNADLCKVTNGLISKFQSMNKPPVADAGPDQAYSCKGCTSAAVTLNGGGSSDPDGDALTYSWSWGFGSASGAVVNADFPLGVHCVTLEVEDPTGHIARDTVAVSVIDPAAAVVPFASSAPAWLSAAGDVAAVAFDEFFPGLSNATGCLVTPGQPIPVQLPGGSVTVTASTGLQLGCAVSDGSTAPKVSDAPIVADGKIRFDFDPPVTAFYTYFGSLASGKTATMLLYDEDASPVTSLTSPPSTHSSLAAGLGFTSSIPIAGVEFVSNEAGTVLVGAFVGLKPGEPSLGTVDLGNYAGPGGSGIIQLDFACSFVATCPADLNGDAVVNAADLAILLGAWGTRGADLSGDGIAGAADLAVLLGMWGACP